MYCFVNRGHFNNGGSCDINGKNVATSPRNRKISRGKEKGDQAKFAVRQRTKNQNQ